MEEKKLLIVLGSMGRGGAERVISYISDYVASKKWKVWIVLLLYNKVDYVLHDNVEIVDLSGNTNSRIKRLPYWIFGLRKLIKQVKPNSVLSFAARINIITQMACLGLNTKVIVSERNDPYSDGRSKVVDMLTNLLYPRAAVVVFQTKRAKTYFNKLNLKNACIIPNPVAVQCKAVAPDMKKIVTVGRLTAQKNQKMLIDAFASVQKKIPNIQLYIYGEGELYQDLSDQIEELGLVGSVFLKGNVPDVHQQIADASMFVLPSDYEGLSNALLEAMMMGLPCISTDCAGSDEYIVSGKNGLLTRIGNKSDMEEGIYRLLNNRDEAQQFGRLAAETVKILYKDVIMEKWYTVIT